MTWQDALELVVARTGHEAYRRLCADDNPDARQRDGYRRVVVKKAGGEVPAAYPPLLEQAGTAARALGRAVRSGFKAVDDAEHARRLAICEACEHFDPKRGRCRKCGCKARWKARLATEHCPLPEPRW